VVTPSYVSSSNEHAPATAGTLAPQVAEWAGHSVNVLLRVYATCIDGQDEAAKQRIEAALTTEPKKTAS
jgi:hypothetical protein